MLTSANMSLAIEPSGPGLPALPVLPGPDVGEAQRLGLDPQLHEAVAGGRVSCRRPLRSRCARPRRWRPSPGAAAAAAAADGGALVHQRGHRDPPALADVADAVGVGHPDLGHVDLVELGLAGDLAQRPDLDAGGVHVEGEVGQALVLGCLGVGAGHEHAPVGDVGERVPHLLAGDRPTRRRRARPCVARPARSEPAPGSLNSWHQASSPVNIRRSRRCLMASSPLVTIVGPAMVRPKKWRAPG